MIFMVIIKENSNIYTASQADSGVEVPPSVSRQPLSGLRQLIYFAENIIKRLGYYNEAYVTLGNIRSFKFETWQVSRQILTNLS